jgi:GNAT superfamily N-acetyltransferase
MSYQLVKIKPEEIEIVHEIISKCGLDLKLKLGLAHWVPPYPIHQLEKDAQERNVYSVWDGADLVATFTIGQQPLVYYDKNIWLHPEKEAIYVSHLAVLPEFQRRGIGSWCMRTIEQMAVIQGITAVRLDGYEKYHKLLKFYDNLGYSRRKVVKYQGLRLVCLEKIIEGGELKSS